MKTDPLDSGPPFDDPYPDGAELICQERERQKTHEGWTDEHDDGHTDEELARAATVYAMPVIRRIHHSATCKSLWPWADDWFKATNRIRELTKAGALIAAEIDRLQRIQFAQERKADDHLAELERQENEAQQ